MKMRKYWKDKMLCRIFLSAVIGCLLAAGCAPRAYVPVSRIGESVDSIVVGKAFPFYNYVAENGSFAAILQKDAALQEQGQRQAARVQTALEQCRDAACYASAAQWNPDEIAAIGNRLAQLCQGGSALHPLPARMREGGQYNLYNSKADNDFIGSVWNDAARGVNGILDTYIKGKRPRYPAIDAISFAVDDVAFREKVRRTLADLAKQQGPKDLFFKLPLRLALWALAINGRDEAARYEPLDQGMNKSAVESIPGIPWSSYPYSLILVPGQGPEKEGLAIDPAGIQRCRLAAERYQKRLAPLIVVSGGHVHPNKTPFSEAVEMKKYMVAELRVPENAILVEPHARHTTTNMRNTARMVYRFKIPEDRKILIVTDSKQNEYIPKMGKRFLDELGYVPYRDLKVLSAEENEFYPTRNALQVNPLDPLDP